MCAYLLNVNGPFLKALSDMNLIASLKLKLWIMAIHAKLTLNKS